MGRAARWLRGLLRGKKTGVGELPAEHKEKRRWGFGKSFREKERPQLLQQQKRGEPPSPAVSEERKGSHREMRLPYERAVMDEENQSKRAIAVAAATAVVAEAAVAAAQAAAVVVRLTSSGRPAAGIAAGKQEAAAIKIQSAFRGYLARRALRALRGLVKLQALVRGNIVRKQAAETLRCMQALVRVQARARASRAIGSETSASDKRPRTHAGLPTVDPYDQAVRANGTKSDNPCTLKRSSSKSTRMETVDSDRASAAAWNWLDRWMEERYWDSREAVRKAGSFVSTDDEKNAKILEVDTGKPQHSGHKKHQHQFSNLTPDHNSHSFTTAAESPSKHSSVQHSVPSPASVDIHQCLGSLMFPVEVMDYGESPQFFSASSRHGNARKGPFTPSKSECARSLFSGYSDYPNYMSNTESSKAKVRSQSAPKQRPELEKTGSTKRSSAHGYGQPVEGALAQRSSSLHAKFANKAYPGSGRLDRLGMPLKI